MCWCTRYRKAPSLSVVAPTSRSSRCPPLHDTPGCWPIARNSSSTLKRFGMAPGTIDDAVRRECWRPEPKYNRKQNLGESLQKVCIHAAACTYLKARQSTVAAFSSTGTRSQDRFRLFRHGAAAIPVVQRLTAASSKAAAASKRARQAAGIGGRPAHRRRSRAPREQKKKLLQRLSPSVRGLRRSSPVSRRRHLPAAVVGRRSLGAADYPPPRLHPQSRRPELRPPAPFHEAGSMPPVAFRSADATTRAEGNSDG